eukprot:jgi/Psemu1/26009/gm1.26009_g
MRPQITDWNFVQAIQFSFVGAGKAVTQNFLNAAYAQKLTDITSLLTYKYGAATLRPGAISNIKSLVTESITANLPESEVSAKYKEHIKLLLENTTIWYNYHGYRDPTIQLEFSIQHWGFRRGWYPYEFAKVYDKNGGATASEKSMSLEPMPTIMSCNNRVANILKFSRRIISRENEFCFDLPDPHFEYVVFEQIYHMAFPPSYTWTRTYSPNSDSVSFRRDKSTVTASHVTPSTLSSSDHHSAPPWEPTSFVWTFNPQNEIATFRRVLKSVPSPQPPMCNRLLPSETLAEDTALPNAAPAYVQSLQSPCCNQLCSKPYYQPVLRLSKQHRDALKIKIRLRLDIQRILRFHLSSSIMTDVIHSGSGGVYQHKLPCQPSGPHAGAFPPSLYPPSLIQSPSTSTICYTIYKLSPSFVPLVISFAATVLWFLRETFSLVLAVRSPSIVSLTIAIPLVFVPFSTAAASAFFDNPQAIMVDQFDWTAIDGILFRFKGNSPYDAQLTGLYSMIMDDIDMEDLFVENADAKVLAPFRMTNLRGSLAKSITYCLPCSTKLQKRHINKLLSGCSICYVASNGVSKTLRDPANLEKVAKDALAHHTDNVYSSKPSITIELIITSWRFTPTWKAHLFDEVYAIPIPVPSSCVGIPPVQLIESAVEPTTQVPAQANKSMIDTPAPNSNVITPNLVPVQPPDSNVNAIVPSPRATLPSDTTKMVHSNAVATPVEALSGTPANFRRTLYPQSQSVVFHRLPKIVSLPKSPIASSLQPIWPKASHEDRHAICHHPNSTVLRITNRHQPVVFHRLPKPISGITKRHRDALKITLYHLVHANILSMNWFYDTIA